MAALDFPSSPTTNQIYTANNRSWLWNGTTWVSVTQSVYNPRTVVSSSTSGTITPDSSTADQFEILGINGAVTIAAPSGSPVNSQRLLLRLKDAGTTQTLTWTTTSGGFRVIGTTLPTSTTANKIVYVGCIYNATDTFWDVVAVSTQG